MKVLFRIVLLIVIMALSGCSNTRFLAKDQILYTGRNKVTISNPYHIKKTSSVKNNVKSVTTYKVNNSLFGRRMLPPLGLWVHNYMKTDEKKKFRSWIYKSLSSAPILISDVNPQLRAAKIENELFDLGYFHSKSWSVVDTNRHNPHKARVSYFVDLAPPFHYSNVLADTLPYQLDSLIRNDIFMKEILPGDQYDLTKLKTSRDGLSRRIQDHGYYYFIPEFVDLNADTTVEKYKIKLMVGKKKGLPAPILAVYKINNIVISNSQGKIDSLSKHDTIYYQNYKIISSGDILDKDVLLRSVYFKKGDTYSYKAYQNTLTNLNSLGVFKYVNISFKRDKIDSLSYLLNIKIDLIMSDNISVDFAANLVTKSTGYSGPALSAGITHGNTFNGAEKLHVAVIGGFEWQWGNRKETQLGTYSYEFGLSSGLTFPRIIVPFNLKPKKPNLLQRTSINVDVSILNRTAYYKMLSGKVNLDYKWSKNKNIRHSFSPVYINAVNLLATSTSFDSVVNENIYIRKSFEEQFIFGMRYEFNYNNTLTIKPNNFFYQAGINTAGNAIDIIAGVNKSEGQRPYYFLNNIYSQFVKFTSDFRYYRNGFNKSLVFRFYAGIGLPYGNSTALPYVEQFFSGGAYSIRGFTARYVGPGAFHQVDQSGYIDQSGDLKLETNLEYRFGMSKVLKGAFFFDAGNIWLVNEDVNRPGSKFDLNTFYNQVAVSAGFGLRLDFTFFVLRTDVGFPLRTPYVTDNRNWLFGTQKIFSGGLFHLAIGYPF